MILYMFQTLYAHHQEADGIDAASGIVLSVSGRPLHRLREKASGAQVERELRSLSTCAPDGHLLRVTIPDAASIQFNLLMMRI